MKKRFKKVYIEITNCCNLSCNFCPKTNRKPEFLTIDRFRTVLDQVKPYTDHVYLHLMGEPLLHPGLSDILDEVAKAGLKVNLTTNGTLLAKNEQLLLAATALRQINISLHSFEANENQMTLTEYISQALDFIIKAQAETKIISSIRLWNMKSEEVTSITSQNANIFQLIEQRLGMKERLSELLLTSFQLKISDQIYLNMAQKFDWPTLQRNTIGDQVFCYGLRDQVGVLVDGTVVPCCLDSEGNLALGNLYEHPFSEIIKSERATRLYEGFSKRIAVEELCKRCGYATRF
jgi:radical SAM protein with 4Fe4S-binding SPASM domain